VHNRPEASEPHKCKDGDTACDFDAGAANSCTFRVQLCFNDDGFAQCSPGVGTFRVRTARRDSNKAIVSENVTRIYNAVVALGGTKSGAGLVFDAPVVTPHLCCEVVDVVVPVKTRPGKLPKPGATLFKTRVVAGSKKQRDGDKIALECVP